MSEKKYLKIEGNAVSLVTERIERTVLLDDFLGEIQKERGFISPILPQGCRLFHQGGNITTFVVEQAPQVRSLTWTRESNENGNYNWKLAFPYVIFVIVFSGEAMDTERTRVFYRTSPLGNGDDNKLLRCNLCNVYEDGHTCTGSMRINGATLAQKAESFVSEFWSSRFNSDLSSQNFSPAVNRFPQVASLSVWQTESIKNPLFPLGIQWFEAGQLNDFLPKGGQS